MLKYGFMHLTFSDEHGLPPVHIQVEEVCWGCSRPTKLQPRLLEGVLVTTGQVSPFQSGEGIIRKAYPFTSQ